MTDEEYCFVIDDDDEITEDAIDIALKYLNSFSEDERKKYWCICGRDLDGKTGKMLGDMFPDNINNLDDNSRRSVARKIKGDRTALQNVKMVKSIPFPVIENCKFVPESIVWNQLNDRYKAFYVNDIFLVANYGDGITLSKRGQSVSRYKSDFYLYKYLLKGDYLKFSKKSANYWKFIYKLRLSYKRIKKDVNVNLYEGLDKTTCFNVFIMAVPCTILEFLRKE